MGCFLMEDLCLRSQRESERLNVGIATEILWSVSRSVPRKVPDPGPFSAVVHV